jgi:hypothetical protein
MVSSSVDVVNAMNNFTVGPAHNITGGIAAMVGGAQTSAEGLNMIQSVGNEVEKVNSNYSSMISSVVMNIKHNNARMQTIQTELLARGVTIDLPVSHVFSGTTSLIIIKSSALLQKINDIQ